LHIVVAGLGLAFCFVLFPKVPAPSSQQVCMLPVCCFVSLASCRFFSFMGPASVGFEIPWGCVQQYVSLVPIKPPQLVTATVQERTFA